MEALQFVGGLSTPLDHVHRVVVFVVNSLSLPKVAWDKSGSPPGTMQIFVKVAGVPIDHYSYESTELPRDIQARSKTMRLIPKSAAFAAVQDKAMMRRARRTRRSTQ
jgi:NTE family protein